MQGTKPLKLAQQFQLEVLLHLTSVKTTGRLKTELQALGRTARQVSGLVERIMGSIDKKTIAERFLSVIQSCGFCIDVEDPLQSRIGGYAQK